MNKEKYKNNIKQFKRRTSIWIKAYLKKTSLMLMLFVLKLSSWPKVGCVKLLKSCICRQTFIINVTLFHGVFDSGKVKWSWICLGRLSSDKHTTRTFLRINPTYSLMMQLFFACFNIHYKGHNDKEYHASYRYTDV